MGCVPRGLVELWWFTSASHEYIGHSIPIRAISKLWQGRAAAVESARRELRERQIVKKKIWTDCKTCFGQIVKLFFWQIIKLFPRHKESSSDLQLDHLAFWRKKCIPQRSHLNLTGPKYRHTFTLYQFQTNLTLYWPNQSMPNFSFIISSKV